MSEFDFKKIFKIGWVFSSIAAAGMILYKNKQQKQQIKIPLNQKKKQFSKIKKNKSCIQTSYKQKKPKLQVNIDNQTTTLYTQSQQTTHNSPDSKTNTIRQRISDFSETSDEQEIMNIGSLTEAIDKRKSQKKQQIYLLIQRKIKQKQQQKKFIDEESILNSSNSSDQESEEQCEYLYEKSLLRDSLRQSINLEKSQNNFYKITRFQQNQYKKENKNIKQFLAKVKQQQKYFISDQENDIDDDNKGGQYKFSDINQFGSNKKIYKNNSEINVSIKNNKKLTQSSYIPRIQANDQLFFNLYQELCNNSCSRI